MTTKTIDSPGIARLVGAKDPNFALHRLRVDPTFPAAVRLGINSQSRTLWDAATIYAWAKNYQHRKKLGVDYHPQLINEMAQQVIRRGWKRGGREIERQQRQYYGH